MKENLEHDVEDQLERGGFPEALKSGIRILIDSLEFDSPIFQIHPRKVNKGELAANIKILIGDQEVRASLSLKRFQIFAEKPSLMGGTIPSPTVYPLRKACAVLRNAVADAIETEMRRLKSQDELLNADWNGENDNDPS